MFDHDDWDRSEIVDLDVTGDPQLDQFGYQSPRGRLQSATESAV